MSYDGIKARLTIGGATFAATATSDVAYLLNRLESAEKLLETVYKDTFLTPESSEMIATFLGLDEGGT